MINSLLKEKNGYKIWKIKGKVLSLHRKNRSFDYPVSFRVGARLDRHYSIFYKRVTMSGSFAI